jgi:hypothetical protein
MLQNFTKGKMAEWLILLIAVVALGLSIGALVRNPCKNSHFGDSGQCVAISTLKKTNPDWQKPSSDEQKYCIKKYKTQLNCDGTGIIINGNYVPGIECHWQPSGGGQPPGQSGKCNDAWDCKSGHTCVCPGGHKADGGHPDEACGPNKGTCKPCHLESGDPCDPKDSKKKYCCIENETCKLNLGGQGYSCQSNDTATKTCGSHLNRPINGKCCGSLKAQPSPYNTLTGRNESVCLPDGESLHQCNALNHPNCNSNDASCVCSDGKDGTKQKGKCDLTNDLGGPGIGGQCIPHHSKTQMGGDGNTYGPNDDDDDNSETGSENGDGGKKDHDNNDRHSTGFGINSSPSPSPGPDPDPKNNLPLIIGASVGGVAALILLIIIITHFV